MPDRNFLRASFNSIARDYDVMRPGYPEALFEDIITLSDLPPGGRCLEIGCGTGQATLPFARRGYRLLCLDLGADMLAIAEENLAAFPNVRFEQVAFEDWQPDPGPFDLVFAATAFHWIPPEVSYAKPAQVLRPGGALAIIYNMQPLPTDGFFVECQEIYRQHYPGWRVGGRRPVAVEIQGHVDQINTTGLFEPAVTRTYPWSATYTTAEYMRLISTFSIHLSLPEANRRVLYTALSDLIDHRFNGQVVKDYLSVLYLARKPGGEKTIMIKKDSR